MRYVITGGSGYLGTCLVDSLSRREDTELIVVADVRPPSSFRPKTRFERLDVRDRGAVRVLLERVQPDVLLHLAFILDPVRDEHRMYDVDVNGTQNVLDAAGAEGTQQVLVTSSAVAYGAFPDNPEPIEEDWPVRGVASFSYARDKSDADRICQLWALEHPERTMTILRPCIVLGPGVDNSLVRLWTKQPFQTDVGNMERRIQFLHQDDLVAAVTHLLHGRHSGAYNLAGDAPMTLRECAEVAGVPIRRMPLRLYRGLAKVSWRLRQSESPPGQIEFAVHPWVVSTEKLKATGWRPRYTSRQAFEIAMRAHGKLPAEPPTSPPPAGPDGRPPVATLAGQDSPGR
ncbi:MAG: NAD-dependent epimerase/dehydratase family protein [Thermoleophilaceae bacterium]